MTKPIDIIANAIHEHEGDDYETGRSLNTASALAGIAAGALTDAAIVANAVQALKESPHSYDDLLHHDDLTNIARIVLGSVAGE